MEALGEARQGPLRLMNTLRALLTVWVCQIVEPRSVFMALEGALRDRAGPTQAILSPGAEARQTPRELILGDMLGGTGMACGYEGRYLDLRFWGW